MEKTPKQVKRKPFLMKPLEGETQAQFKARLLKMMKIKPKKNK